MVASPLRLTAVFILVPLAVLAIAGPARADDEPAPAPAAPAAEEPVPEVMDVPIQELGPITVTARRTADDVEIEVPRAVNIVTKERILERSEPSLLDALDDQIGLWVEKRTAHTSDLVMRGFSGGNLLALVNGGTLSTFWGEGGFAGDDMYGKIDPESIGKIEVVRGPSSVLYGSNALGGVINFITKESPFDYTQCGSVFGARTQVAASTAPSMWRLRQEFYGASPSMRWFVGGSGWDAGGTRDGSGQDQRPTGGNGWFGDAHLSWKLNDTSDLHVTLQYTNNEQVYKYFRPNQDNSNLRIAVTAWLDLEDVRRLGIADEAHLKVYYQKKEDERRWFDATTGALTKEGIAKWDTIQAGIQLGKRIACDHHVTYGIDFQSTAGESPDDEQFTITPVGGVKEKASPDSWWSSLGVYVQDVWDVNKYLTLTGSARFDVFRIATEVDQFYTPAGGLNPLEDEFTDYESALVGGLQATVHLCSDTKLFGGWTRGFRQFAPRFGVSQTGYGVIVPSKLLTPITADMFEVGFKHHSPYLQGEIVGYYTDLSNFQNIVRGTFQGLDWYDFDQDTVRHPGGQEDVYVTTGNGDAYVYGVEVAASFSPACWLGRRFECFTIGGGFQYNYGQDTTNDIPLRHTHPARGLLKLRYDHPDPVRGLWLEAAGNFVGRYTRIPPSRLAGDVGYYEDPQDPTSGKRRTWGLPGYSFFDLRGGMNITKNVTIVAGIENVFDKLYRPAHARWDAAGRNFFLTLEVEI